MKTVHNKPVDPCVHTQLQAPQLIQSTCPYCGVGCGVDIQVSQNRDQKVNIQAINGSIDHPANFGKLCVKGSHLLETNSPEGRMVTPSIKGKASNWQESTSYVAKKIKQAIEEFGPDSVAFYVSGQLLTEDYYVANKLMKGFIGSANIDTNSRLCMSSAVAAQKRAFGADSVPCSYEDLDMTELVIFVGSNAAWTHPVLYQRIERAKALNPSMKTIFIDPRKTASCENADLHLAIKPGTDVALFNGLLRYLKQNNALDAEFIEKHTLGFEQAIEEVEDWTPLKVSKVCDLPINDVLHFYEAFTQSKSSISFYSMGVNQSSQGVDKGNSIINCHLATGKIGKPGSAPFSITGQPNAMGGREVGGLANMLAAHMDIENETHHDIVSNFWNTSKLAKKAGLKAVDLFDEAVKGKIKVLWIMATNPMVSMPNRHKIEKALQQCDTVIVSDCVSDSDTLKLADVCLPASGWSEKNGTVTNSERRISRQRGVLPPPGQAKHDWQIICEVAKEMGFGEAFDYRHPAQIFAEHAKLSGMQNDGRRDFDISMFSEISTPEYDQLRPIQWPVTPSSPHGTKRLFTDNRFYTATGRANFIVTHLKLPEKTRSEDDLFVLNSGRLRDQWHTMTRTGKASELLEHKDSPFLDIHPEDARRLGLKQNDLVSILSESNKKKDVVLPINTSDDVREGELFVPIHWNGSWGSSSSIGALFDDTVDPISGQPELKYAQVKLEHKKLPFQCQILCKSALQERALSKLDYWQMSRVGDLYYYHFGNVDTPIDRSVLCELFVTNDLTLLTESGKGKNNREVSMVALKNKALEACFYIDSTVTKQILLSMKSLFKRCELDNQTLGKLLRGQYDLGQSNQKQICSCNKVSEAEIQGAIANGINTVESLGKSLQCGTNCGSCKPEIQCLINQSQTTSDRITLSKINVVEVA
ncbi:nitrate reductase [Aliiglaciecola sp. M165]|uniref:nitrate reductase n=1 Tax=Aliiglaciecola sp. M165 TaxID=2593649 RepID=UPI00117DD6DB|nr:nitrate reductase [Aliiglaciecola sp. M165]TRY30214.1 molybdopterin-dependent oxidoreductase [Aliiglaciecola sp. M165]